MLFSSALPAAIAAEFQNLIEAVDPDFVQSWRGFKAGLEFYPYPDFARAIER
jgi:hypothetical protein